MSSNTFDMTCCIKSWHSKCHEVDLSRPTNKLSSQHANHAIARPRLWETNQSGRLILTNSKYERRVEDQSRDSMSTSNHTCTYYQLNSLRSESITLLRPPSLQNTTARCERLTPVKCVIWWFLIWVLLSKRWTRYVFRVLTHRFCGNGPALTWFSSYLTDRTQAYRHDDQQSQLHAVNYSLTQSSVLRQ